MPDVLDTRALVAELVSKHGIHVDDADPALAIVALNRLVLEKSTDQISERIRLELKEFEEGVAKVQRRAGQLVAEEFNDHLSAVRNSLQTDITLAGAKANEIVYRIERANGYPVMIRWTVIGCFFALVMFTIGVLVGWGYLPHARLAWNRITQAGNGDLGPVARTATDYSGELPIQSSVCKFDIRPNSRILCVASIRPSASAIPAIRTSYAPMRAPLDSSSARAAAERWAAALVRGKTWNESQNSRQSVILRTELRLRCAPKKSSATVITESATSSRRVTASRSTTDRRRPRMISTTTSVSRR